MFDKRAQRIEALRATDSKDDPTKAKKRRQGQKNHDIRHTRRPPSHCL